jgi:hypothetical protein
MESVVLGQLVVRIERLHLGARPRLHRRSRTNTLTRCNVPDAHMSLSIRRLAIRIECRAFRRERIRTETRRPGQHVFRQNALPSVQVNDERRTTTRPINRRVLLF